MYDDNDMIVQRMGLIIGLVLVVLISCFLLFVKTDLNRDGAERSMAREMHSFKRVTGSPELPSMNVAGPDGQEIDLKGFRGKYVLLNFWTTWCAPCVEELPTLDRLKTTYKRPDFQIMAVSLDDIARMEQIPAFLTRLNVGDVAYYHDYRGDLQKAFPIEVLPTTYIISPDGRIIYQMIGGTDWSSPTVTRFLDSL